MVLFFRKQEDIAKDLSVTQQYVSSILSGKKSVGKKVAAKLSELYGLYGLSYSWLLTGEGDMLQLSSIQNNTKNKIMDKLERINKAIDFLRFKKVFNTQKELAVILEKPAPNVSDALKGGKYFTDKFVICFSEKFKDFISKDWLLTGEGEMLRDQSTTNIASNNTYGDNASGKNNITITSARAHTREEDEGDKHKEIVFRPVVTKQLATQSDTDVYSVIKNDKTLKLQYIPTIPPYTSIDFYYTIRQDAMLPEYKLGEVLALEHMKSNSDIVQGAAMVVDTSDFGFLFRRIYDRGDYYECRRINENSVFENQNVPKSKVIRLYRVIYSMKFGD